ncbi:CorA family divalent cation transporter, partial [Kitasatospora sp. NPDC127059]|uniref:CorA family divalent cation transporter n=1 Tax=unclassified Kitasatospora TaxID=2633591 RepID=UPI00366363C5
MSDWRVRAVRASKRPFSRQAVPRRPVDPRSAPEHSMDPRPDQAVEPVALERSVVDAAVYRDGRRTAAPADLADIYRELPEQPGAMAWIGLFRPAEAQLLEAADRFNLHELAVEDAIVAHQRPKLERYGDTLFVVLRAARYLDDVEEVDFGEI